MACNANKAPLLRAIAKRGFAASANPRPIGDTATVAVKVLDNKLVVATAESALPVARVSIVLRAGSRNETYDLQGASHILRLAAGLSTRNTSGFAIARNIQQVGGSLIAAGDRETVSYTLETTADNVETGLRYLQDLVQPAFKPWEISDNLKTLRTQSKSVSPQERAIELAHRAAFRTGLGNSIYSPKYQIGNISSESLLHYVATTFSPSRTAVVGVGIDNNTLAGFAQTLELPGGDSKTITANYYGGDGRKNRSGQWAHVAVAGPGGALSNHKEALAFAILEQAVGSAAATKRGNSSGTFGQAVACAATDGSIAVRAINASYSDAGLFGFLVSADARSIGKAVEFLTRGLKSASVSDQDVARGKALLKAQVLNTFSSDSALLKELGTQAAINRTVIDANTLISAIDGITKQQVQEAAKKVGSAKLSVGAVGNLAHVPYSSDLA